MNPVVKPSPETVEEINRACDTAREENRQLRILFVCLGNICRSPAAEGILRKLAETTGIQERIEIDSAGFYGGHAGDLPDRRMRITAIQHGYDLTHRSRTVKPSDFYYFDLIFGMDNQNLRDLHRTAPDEELDRKILPMANLALRFPDITEVPDPYWDGIDGFHNVLNILEDACSELIKLITKA